MFSRNDRNTRRGFLGTLGALSVGTVFSGVRAKELRADQEMQPTAAADWDLSWIPRIERATNKAVFDIPSIQDGMLLDIATRYLDNCDVVYGKKADACAVLNIRTQATPLALNDEMWKRFGLGAQYTVTDPVTKQPAERNRFLTVPPDAWPGTGALNDLRARGSIFLVCDFALGHLAARLAPTAGIDKDEVRRVLLSNFIPGAILVPSGIFGMARAQNAGAALVKMP